MKSNSGWRMTGTALSLMMTAGVLVLGYALVRVHPINQIESLTLFMNCGEGFQAQSASTEPERIRHFSVCVDRIGPVESRSTSACAEGSGRFCRADSAQNRQEAHSNSDALPGWRL
jgi:hypothetical protein